jgi:hypothetical protein
MLGVRKMFTINNKETIYTASGLKLENADIVLVHTKKSLWGWIIRRGTHCYWNHALIVCSPGSPENAYNDALVIDAKTGGTIEMEHLQKYLSRRGKYDIAVKRFEANWFCDRKQSNNPDLRKRICDIAEGEAVIKSKSKPRELLNQVMRQLTIISRFLRRKLFRARKSPNFPWSIRPIQMKAFTCGGFIQWCYYKAVAQLAREKRSAKPRIQDIVFNPRAEKRTTPYELLTTTPADLANCNKLTWKYIVTDGLIREAPFFQETKLSASAI